MSNHLTVDDFAELVGSSFSLASIKSVGLTLETVTALGAPLLPGGREPFSLTFKGPASPILPQGIHRLQGESEPALEIFLVPIGRDESGAVYEAVFT